MSWSMDNSLLLALGMLGLVMLGVAALRLAQFRRVTVRDLTRAERASLRSQAELRDGMETLLNQLDEVARRVQAAADTQLQQLNDRLAAADERIARLEQLLAQTTVERPAPGVARPDAAQPRSAVQPPTTALRGGAAADRATRCATPHATLATTPDVPGAPPALDERRQRVFELADEDTPPLTIADLLQMPIGEVELILSLREFAEARRT